MPINQIKNKVNKSNANFVKRLKQINRQVIPDWESNRIATHKLSVGTDRNGVHFIYPEVQEVNNKLIDYTRPPYNYFAGQDNAIERKDTVQIGNTNKDLNNAIKFTEEYKQYYPEFKVGGKTKHKIEAEGGEVIQSNKPFTVKRGGIAIPLGDGFSLLKGKSHEQGGIDIDMKGSGRIWSDVPLLNGKSPAERLLEGEDPNILFTEQEIIKNTLGLNDDGSKKRLGGEEQPNMDHLIGKIKPEEINREHIENLTNPTLNIYFDKNNNFHISPFEPSKEYIINNGLASIIPSKLNKILKPYRRNLDYIGGDKAESRKTFYNKFPKTTEFIDSIANKYNITPNLLKHRLAKEGMVDDAIKYYNNLNNHEQKEMKNNFLNYSGTNGFTLFGLDDGYEYLMDRKEGLRDDVEWYDTEEINEKGRKVKSATGKTVRDNIILEAAVLEHLKNKMKDRGIPENKLETWTNASFNLGPYHENLSDSSYIEKNYSIPDYNKKRMGGDTNGLIYHLTGNVKQGSRYLPFTGERKKALLGLTTGDWIKGGTNLVGSLLSFGHNLSSAKNIPEVPKPVYKQAVKLNTNYNINPQLNTLSEMEAASYKDINSNTSSSNTALGRRQAVKLNSLLSRNELYNTKEQEENKLINTDRLNQQEVANANVDLYNAYLDKKYAKELKFNKLRDDAVNGLINNLAGTVGNLIEIADARQERKNDLENKLDMLSLIYGDSAKNVFDKIRKRSGLNI